MYWNGWNFTYNSFFDKRRIVLDDLKILMFYAILNVK